MPVNFKPSEPTLDQARAYHAWSAVQHVDQMYGKGEDAKKFGGQARKLPTRIIASGLGQALAFLKAKNYAPELLTALGDWVLQKRNEPESWCKPEPDGPGKKPKVKDDALLLKIIQGDSDFLRRATDETLAYLLWLNRFAEAAGLADLTETD